MGATAGLQVVMRHPEKVDQLVAISVAYDFERTQPTFREFVPRVTVAGTPMEDAWRELAPNADGFRAFVDKMIALEHEPMAWEEDVRALETPVLIVTGDADYVTLGTPSRCSACSAAASWATWVGPCPRPGWR